MDIKITVILSILVVAAFIDIKKGIIPDNLSLIAFITGIVFWIFGGFKSYYIISTIIAFVTLMFIAIITDGSIGGGDIKIMTAISMYMGIQDWLTMFLAALISALVIEGTIQLLKIKKQKKVIFVPYILIGYAVVSLGNYIG